MQKLAVIWVVAFVAFCVATVTFTVAYNVWASLNGLPQLSHHIRELSRDWPILVFLFGLTVGLLAGHWWWGLSPWIWPHGGTPQ